MPRSTRFDMLEVRRLRVHQKTRRDGEGRSLGGVWQPGNAERQADADRTIEDIGGKLRQTRELAGAAGEDDAGARLRREWRFGEPVAQHLQDFLDARLDDAHQIGARYELRRLAL